MDAVKSFLSAHFEKILLLLGIVYLVWVLVAQLGSKPIDAEIDELQPKIDRINSISRAKKVPEIDQHNFSAAFNNYRSDISPGQTLYQWALAIRPVEPPVDENAEKAGANTGMGGPDVQGGGGDTPVDVQIPAGKWDLVFGAVDFEATVRMGIVELSWKDSSKNQLAIEGYNVYRRKVGENWPDKPLNEELIAPNSADRPKAAAGLGAGEAPAGGEGGLAALFGKQPATQPATPAGSAQAPAANKDGGGEKVTMAKSYSFTDLELVPKANYEYRVVGTAHVLNGDKKIPVLTNKAIENNPVKRVYVPEAVKIYYTGAGGGQATITVQKFTHSRAPLSGEVVINSVHKRFNVPEKGKIGEQVRVWVDGKARMVDFTTSFVLNKIVSKKDVIEDEKEVTTVDAQGNPIKKIQKVTRIQERKFIEVLDAETKKTIEIDRITPIKLKKILDELAQRTQDPK